MLLWILVIALVVLWGGLALLLQVGGDLVHFLLVLAAIVVLVRVIRGKKPWGGDY